MISPAQSTDCAQKKLKLLTPDVRMAVFGGTMSAYRGSLCVAPPSVFINRILPVLSRCGPLFPYSLTSPSKLAALSKLAELFFKKTLGGRGFTQHPRRAVA